MNRLLCYAVNAETETREILQSLRDRRTGVFRVVVQLVSECEVLRLLFDGQRQVEKPASVVPRYPNTLLLQRALVDLKADQREYRQHKHGQDADIA